jgi:hypothetical protein
MPANRQLSQAGAINSANLARIRQHLKTTQTTLKLVRHLAGRRGVADDPWTEEDEKLAHDLFKQVDKQKYKNSKDEYNPPALYQMKTYKNK